MELQKDLSFRTIKALLKRGGFSMCDVYGSPKERCGRTAYGGQFDVTPERGGKGIIRVRQLVKRRKTLQDVAKFLRQEGYHVCGRVGKQDESLFVCLQIK